ncbi:hypothetical protein KUL150_28670 [Alteromonas sp. KUL150]|nr:hypothetical protein KUL150_28670 [Alteromonas sp. KUL150]
MVSILSTSDISCAPANIGKREIVNNDRENRGKTRIMNPYAKEMCRKSETLFYCESSRE